MKNFNEYINEVAKVKDELEHSGRTFLQNLLTDFTNTHKINIIHESKRDKKGRGAPDFKFLFNDTEIGYLENKKIGEDLDEVLKSDQIRKYKTLTDNLILTDYIRWIWIYKDEVVKDISLCNKSVLEVKTIKLNEQNCNDLSDLINDFLSQKPQEIVKARDLAEKLSKPTRTIKEEINDIVTDSESDKTSRIIGTYKVFKAEISENITPEDFADAFAQTLTYSLFLTKITLTSSEKLTLSNIANLTPKSFALIKDILAFINEIEDYPQLKPYIERIFHIINHTNAFEVVSDLQNIKDEFEDAYIHFYENFLTAYDKEKRKELGVWYTPKPVVRSIINNIHEILKEDFNLADGLADESVKLLDFACGTGTFLFEVYDKILSEISQTSLKRAGLIKNHILKNIFGFELLIPAYCVSHLKLSQHLKDEGYALEKDDRIRVYFTNTLENRHPDKQASLYENFFPSIAKEGKEAQEIKDDKSILVITGNPPYNGTSLNNFDHIQQLIKPYFPNDEIKEKNPKWLQDDYVKFIRFAENKIANAGKGVVGVITSHSFIDNPTFRAMRKHLMDTFDKIYIIDLHGNTKKKEKCPDGGTDQNVFAIQQGVAISFFVKTSNKKECEVHHLDIFGKKMPKFEQISKIDLQKNKFTKLNPSSPFYLFIPQDVKVREEYEKGVSLRDIWQEMNVGIVTGKDEKVIAFNEKELQKKIKNNFSNFDKQFIQDISYRPFDNRKIYYETKTKGIIERARTDIMSHLLNNQNVGLVFVRQVATDSFNHCFISNKIMESCFISSTTKEINYIAPLYLYTNHLGTEQKTPNFKSEFAKMLAEKFEKPTPEEVLGYIYAVLHSQTYRTKYLEFLKIDFPRIPFDCDKTSFKKLANIGQELIDAHLMRKIPKSKIGEPESDGIQNFTMEKVAYNQEKQRLYFNKTCYFADVSPAVWEFKIGGYQVLKQYLEGGKSTSRKGIDISSDLTTIQNIIKVLDFTIGKMGEIDNCILLV